VIGVIEADQIEDGKRTTNNRLIGVAIHSYSHEDLQSINDVSKSILDQVEEFFITYNESRGKKFKVKDRKGPRRAAEIIEGGQALYQKKKP
jgi:inorganic pyrophosphatase